MRGRSLWSRTTSAALARLARLVLAGSLLLVSALAVELGRAVAARADEIAYACGVSDAGAANNLFTGYETFGINVYNGCGESADNGLQVQDDGVNTIPYGATSGWQTTAPAGMAIVSAYVPSLWTEEGLDTTGLVANIYWAGGQQQISDVDGGPYRAGGFFSNYFGFNVGCAGSGGSACAPNGLAEITVTDIQLTAEDTVNPSFGFNSSNLWYEGSVGDSEGTQWVYGQWPLGFSAAAPSGIDTMSASMNGQNLASPSAFPTCRPNDTIWQQCPNGVNWTPTTTLSGDGDQQLSFTAMSAAGNQSTADETIHVDTTQPTVTLSGPADASSAAGPQYVTATANVGPSGLGSMSCSVDGVPAQSYSSSPAEIPVSGIGMHSVQCTASNRSINEYGQVAVSDPATFSMDIGEPTASGISFSNIIHSLKCKKVPERVKVAAKWVTVRRHRNLVKVHRRAHTERVKVVKCHDRIARRKVAVLVKVKRHGKTVMVKRTKVEKVVLPPQVVNETTKRVAYGGGTTVSGILATTDGTALGGRTVDVLTAPDNGLEQWTQTAVVTTSPDGAWTTTLPGGPSRLVEATYAGDNSTLPSTSSTIHLVVPAKVNIHISPRSTRWGGTIMISGRVLGGYIPAGKLLRLRIGVEGVHATVGIPSVRRDGRFRTTWTFSSGRGVVHYWFSVSTLNEADYPYAPASSRRVYVTAGRR